MIKNILITLIYDGKFGNYLQAKAVFGKSFLCPIKNKDGWRSVYKQYEKYECIEVMPIKCTNRIGELVARYLMIMNYIECQRNAKTAYICRLYKKGCNSALIAMISGNINIVNDNNVDVYVKALSRLKKIRIVYNDRFIDRNATCGHRFDSCRTKGFFVFPQDKLKICIKECSKHGLDNDYVCIANRDSAYLRSIYNTDMSYHDHRDSDIHTRGKLVDYLMQEGIPVVRMGRNTEEEFVHNNCLDFSNKNYDEWLDLYLLGHCKFFVSDISGISTFPEAYDVKVVHVNNADVGAGGFNGCASQKSSLMIFKLVYSESKNRFLSFEEMLNESYLSKGRNDYYISHNMRFVDNTADDILEVSKEMNERIDGTYAESDDNKYRQKVIESIIVKFCEERTLKRDCFFDGLYGAKFLEKYWGLLVDN